MENTNIEPQVIVAAEDPQLKAKKTFKICKRLVFWAIMAVLFQFLISAGIATVGNSVFSLAQRAGIVSEEASMSSDKTMLVTAVAYVVANTVAALICFKATKTGKIKSLFKGNKFTALDTVAGVVAILGFSFVLDNITTIFESFFANSNEFVSSIIGDSLGSTTFGTICTVLYVCILGPITEEILCRGAVLRASSPVSKGCAIFISSLLFGLVHGNFTQIFQACIMGILLAYVAIKSGSIIVPCIMHIANNSISTGSAYLFAKCTPEQVKTITISVTIVFAVLAVLSTIYLVKKFGLITKNDKIEGDKVVSSEDVEEAKSMIKGFTVKTVVTCPVFWIALVLFNAMAIAMATGVLNA